MRTAKLKSAYNSLIIGPRGFGALSLRWIQFASVLQCARSSLSRTSDLRQGRSLLFVSLLKSKQGDIAAQTISNWIKDLIHFTLKNCSTENASHHGVKAHDIRAQAASWSFSDIMRSCTWKNHSTFTSFYFRNVSLKNLEGSYRLGDIVAAQRVVSLSI